MAAFLFITLITNDIFPLPMLLSLSRSVPMLPPPGFSFHIVNPSLLYFSFFPFSSSQISCSFIIIISFIFHLIDILLNFLFIPSFLSILPFSPSFPFFYLITPSFFPILTPLFSPSFFYSLFPFTFTALPPSHSSLASISYQSCKPFHSLFPL